MTEITDKEDGIDLNRSSKTAGEEVKDMRCPECEEGIIEQITMRRNGEKAQICNYCGSMWREGERIGVYGMGHNLQSFVLGSDMEYGYDENPALDQEHEKYEYNVVR